MMFTVNLHTRARGGPVAKVHATHDGSDTAWVDIWPKDKPGDEVGIFANLEQLADLGRSIANQAEVIMEQERAQLSLEPSPSAGGDREGNPTA